MKKNLPVTQQEVPFPEGQEIISITNLRGIITSFNDTFRKISGFETDELLNKNHNVIRHPDMPPAAYEDLWKHIKRGDHWMGIIKNRVKNGDHYWVDGYISPVIEGGEVTGYESVRSKPSKERAKRAEQTYQRMREKRRAGFLLLLFVQWGLIHHSLKPLKVIRQQLQKLGRGEAEQIRADVPDEVMPVVDELNRSLATLTRKTQRSRQALGNLAHALKSKLTLFNQVAENQQLDQDSRTAIYHGSESMRQVIERELKRARLLGAPLPSQRVDLPSEVNDLSDTLQRIYTDKRLQIQINIEEHTRFAGDREDLLEMLGNVLDNAAKWAEKQLKIQIYQDNGVVFDIADDGPGCPPETLT